MGSGLLRAAVIGLGRMGQVAVIALSRDPTWTVAAVADPDEGARAEALRFASGAHSFGTADELLDTAALDRHGIDAVFVMTPPASHASITVAALEAGRHVVCEKPMARTTAECDAMLAALNPGRIGVIDHQLRYNMARRHIRDELARGAFGVPLHVDVVATFPSLARTSWSWWSSLEEGGGLLYEYGSHTVDLLHWWFGPSARATGKVRTVVASRPDATGTPRAVDSDDLSSFRLEWSDGLFAVVTLSGVAHRLERTIVIHTSELTLVLDAEDQLHVHRSDGAHRRLDLAEREPSLIGDPLETYTQPFARLVADVAVSIRQGTQPAAATSFADGRTVIERLEDVRRSSTRSTTPRTIAGAR